MMFSFARGHSGLRHVIAHAYRRDEAEAVADLLPQAQMTAVEQQACDHLARRLVTRVRQARSSAAGVDALMHEFALSSEEGVALMCLAEALLRIPDKNTRNRLIQDKLADGDWKKHVHNSPSLFVNATAWGLLITGKLSQKHTELSLGAALTRLLGKGGAPLIRKGVDYAMRLLGQQFVTGQTIAAALENGRERECMGYRFSFDMLGEAAMTQADADRYYQDYVNAIHAIGAQSAGRGVYEGNGISVKLSAIHPRYQRTQRQRVMAELLPRLKQLFLLAKQYDIGVNIDAEEAHRLDISLDLLEALAGDADLLGFHGIGFVVQAYQKRCPYVIDFLIDLARRHRQRLMVRLVKGAYWDSEIKWAQVEGLEGYPVYTRKAHTDVSYLACARKLLAAQDAVFPQFATHNAHTLAAVYHMGLGKDFEFQCLHGMGETLYDQVVGAHNLGRRVRIYAPVGTHKTLLAYLVRRLLENGANSSFVNQIVDEKVGLDALLQNPVQQAAAHGGRMHAALPLPRDLYGCERLNARGLDLNNEAVLQQLQQAMNAAAATPFQAAPLLAVAHAATQPPHPVRNPAKHHDVLGQATFLQVNAVADVVAAAVAGQAAWAAQDVRVRADCLRRFADALEAATPELMMLAVREAGKTLANALAEVREAADFCRYYAAEAEHHLADARPLGTVATISPWNFPLAIFVGQTVAALVAGNTVLAKPAEQTSLMAYRAVQLLHASGVPRDAVQLVLGADDVGATLVADRRINGVLFTGSNAVARHIHQQLNLRTDMPVLVAETGGQNAMIVDSTALPEQVCADVLQSAFDSAGQRCSALRVLCLQEDIAETVLTMLKGAMDELCVGDPARLETDIGPVIDAEAQQTLVAHIEYIRGHARSVHQAAVTEAAALGTFVPPTLVELEQLSALQQEVFGPVLHVVRYAAADLDTLLAQINHTGYALTHGIHSRIDATVAHISQRIEAGNIYVNRNIIGAVVGVQPFGGHGRSGTGPKAGGPFYLQRLVRDHAWRPPVLSRSGQADTAALKRLQQLIAVMDFSSEQRALLARTATDACIHTLRQAEQVLPGPTGERNTLYWRALARVWLYGGDIFTSMQALICLAAAGSRAYVLPQHPLALWREPLDEWLSVSPHPLNERISHVLQLALLPDKLRAELAACTGPIVQLLDVRRGVDMPRLFREVSLSVNTAAIGGNARLMAMSEQ